MVHLRRTEGGFLLTATTPGRDLTRFGWFSIGVALVTMAIKLVAWSVTGSVGLLSDALESTVNLAAALMRLTAYASWASAGAVISSWSDISWGGSSAFVR